MMAGKPTITYRDKERNIVEHEWEAYSVLTEYPGGRSYYEPGPLCLREQEREAREEAIRKHGKWAAFFSPGTFDEIEFVAPEKETPFLKQLEGGE